MKPKRQSNLRWRGLPLELVLTLAYLGIALGWIFFSDRGLALLVRDQDQFVRWSVYKGWFYVVVTALLLFVCLKRVFDRVCQVQAELEAGESRYRLMVEAQTDLVVKVDVENRFLFVSPSYCAVFSKTEKELLGSTFLPLVHEDDRAASAEAIKDVFKPPHTAYMEQRAMTKSGWRWFAWQDTGILDEHGDVVEIIGVGRDITAQKRAEQLLRDSSERLHLVTQAAQIGIWDYQIETDELIWDDLMFELYGIDKSSFSGAFADWADAVHPADLPRTIKAWEQAMSGAPFYDCEFRVVREDGTVRHIRTLGVVQRDATGKAVRVVGANWDVTSQREVIGALQQSEADYRLLFKNMMTGFAVFDVVYDDTGVPCDYRLIQMNPAAEAMADIDASSAMGRTLREILPELEESWLELYAQVAASGTPVAHDGYATPFKRYLEVWIFMPRPGQLAVVFSDVSARRMAENAVSTAQQQLEYIVNNTNDCIFQIDLKGRCIYCNTVSSKVTGFTQDELLRMNMFELVVPEYRSAVVERLRRRIEGNSREDIYSFEISTKDGRRLWMEINTSGVFNAGGELVAVQAVARDITERWRTQLELVRLSTAIEQSPDVVVITGPDGSIQYVNPAFESVTGYSSEEVSGKNPRILKSGEHGPEFYANLWKTITAGKVWTGQLVNKRKNGTLYTEEVSISPVKDPAGRVTNYVAVKRDITADLVHEEELRQAQKMEAVGQLAGGIAHDFNNILQGILGFSEMLKLGMDKESRQYDNVNEIQKAAKRAADLTRQLLTFSRKQPSHFTLLDLNHVVCDSEALLALLLGGKNSLVLDLDTNLPAINADQGQLTQIIMNLGVNARDAMPAGGRVTLATEYILLDHADAARISGANPGSFACLSVTDTGLGMEAAVKDRLFEPFFTTKEVGSGTGLGLAVVYGIVKQNKGWINVYSEPGKGSCFKIFLPIAHPFPNGSESSAGRAGTPRRILLVEDDPEVAGMVVEILEGANYKLEVVSSAEDGLALFSKGAERFDLLLSDMILPGMHGEELADMLREIKPSLPVLLYSGYRDHKDRWNEIGNKGYCFTTKPFTISGLLERVETAFKMGAK